MPNVRPTLTRIGVTAAGFAAVGVALVSGSPTATAATVSPSATYQGCPSGYACVYPDASWNGGHPSFSYYTYGAHNLSNVYGVRRFFNNQTGGAKAKLCTGYNGGGTCETINSYTYGDRNFTPINSIVLVRP